MNWRLHLGLALNMVVFATVLNSVGIVVERSISEWNVAKSVGGTLEGCKDLTIAFSSLFLASQVARWGYRRVMMGCLLCVILASTLLAGLQQFWTVPVFFIICGASFALMKVSVYTLVGWIARDSSHHAALMNRMEGIYQVGALAAPLVFSWMIAHGSWFGTYWFVAALGIVALLTWAVTSFAEPAPPTSSQEKGSARSEVLALLKQPSICLFLLSGAIYVMIEQSISTWLPTFLRDVFELKPERAAALLSLYFGSLALSRFLFGVLVRYVSAFWLQLVALLTAFGSILVVLLSTGNSPTPAFAYLLASVGLFIGPIYPTLNSLALSRLDRNLHSSMTGLIIVASALGGTIGSQILGWLSQKYSTHTAFHFPLLPIAALTVLWIYLHKRSSDDPS